MINQIMTLFITFFFKSEKRETNKNQDKAINNSIFLLNKIELCRYFS